MFLNLETDEERIIQQNVNGKIAMRGMDGKLVPFKWQDIIDKVIEASEDKIPPKPEPTPEDRRLKRLKDARMCLRMDLLDLHKKLTSSRGIALIRQYGEEYQEREDALREFDLDHPECIPEGRREYYVVGPPKKPHFRTSFQIAWERKMWETRELLKELNREGIALYGSIQRLELYTKKIEINETTID